MSDLNQAIELFLGYGELGRTDAQNLNQLIPHLENGQITKQKVIALLFSSSKNQDSAYRAFLSRINDSLQLVTENETDVDKKLFLQSLEITPQRATKQFEARLTFSAQKPRDFHFPTRVNRDYAPENYIENQGTDDQLTENPIKLFISYATADKFAVNLLKDKLLASLNASAGEFSHWSMQDLVIGDNFDQIIQQNMQDCDFGLAMFSQAFFASNYITQTELKLLSASNKLLPIGLDSSWNKKQLIPSEFFTRVWNKYKDKDQHPNIHEALTKQAFFLQDRNGDFFTACSQAEEQARFVEELTHTIHQKIAFLQETEEAEAKKTVKSTEREKRALHEAQLSKRQQDYEDTQYINNLGVEDDIAEDYQLHLNKESEEKTTIKEFDVLDDMFNWLNTPDKPLYALLGDYGMGKTFTCRMFTQRLTESNNPSLPKPIYIDLRDSPTFIEDQNLNIHRQPTLEEMLTIFLQQNKQQDNYTADTILKQVAEGKLCMIFDGLDEKLVYYTQDMRHQFFQELLKAYPQGSEPATPCKIMVSCRTHHFESIRQQNNFLSGLSRAGVSGEDYRALSLLPFNSSQILQLLTNKLGSEEANHIYGYIQDEAYLKKLAERPLLLNQMAGSIPKIYQQIQQGTPLNAASFYQSLVDTTFERDQGKHIMRASHKKQLLTDIAFHLWQQQSTQLPFDDLVDWFHLWLSKQTKLTVQYQKHSNEVLQQDLRNSSLLVRFDEQDFGFSHSSFFEYFLSLAFIKKWLEGQAVAFSHSISQLTFNFIVDGLHLLSANDYQKVLVGLASSIEQGDQAHSQIVYLRLLTQLNQLNKPVIACNTISLTQIKQPNFIIRGLSCQHLHLNDCDFHHSQFIDVNITTLSLSNTNLSDSLWRRCYIERLQAPSSNNILNRMTAAESDLAPLLAISPSLDSAHCYPTAHGTTLEQRPACEKVQFGHVSSITNAVFSPDGRHIISASGDNTIKLWDLKGQCLLTFEGHNDWVHSVAFSPDGRHIISASGDNTIKLWDLKGQCLQTFKGHHDWVHSVAFSPDGQHIISASADNTLKLWDLEGQCLQSFEGHHNSVNSVAFSPDGQHIISGSREENLKLWNLDGECLQILKDHDGLISSAAFSPDGLHIISGSNDHTLKLWNLDGQCLQTFEGHHHWVNSVAFSPDGQHIISASGDSTIKLWDLKGQCLQTFESHHDWVNSVAFSCDGQHIISASDDKTIKLWDLKGQCLHTFEGLHDWVNSVAFSPDEKHIISASGDSTIKLWDLKGQCLQTFKGHHDWVNSVAFSPDGRHIISASDDKTIKLWDLKGQCLQTFGGHYGWINSVAFSPDGQHIVSASSDQTLKLWDLEGQCLQTFEGHHGPIRTVAFSPDGLHIISGSDDKTVKLWDLKGQCLQTFKGHHSSLSSVAYSPDGLHIVSCSEDGIRYWDVTTRRCYMHLLSFGKQQLTIHYDQTERISKIIGTDLTWKWATLIDEDGQPFPIDQFDNFEYQPIEAEQ